MKAGNREQFAVGRKIERGNDRGTEINGRMRGVIMFSGIGRRIVFCALLDLLFQKRDVGFV